MRTAIVTGSSKGIGANLVKNFLTHDYKVICTARNENEFTKSLPSGAKFVKADVSQRKDHQRLVQFALEWTGRLDVYINNAGLSHWKTIDEIDEEFLNAMIDVNLKASFWGAQAAGQYMKPGGSIINISSLAGKRGSANNSAYCATKFAVNGLTQSLAKELGPKGIRVNAVCPVYIKTENLLEALKSKTSPTNGMSVEKYFEQFQNSQAALMRLPTADEVSETCLFLASEKASAITGQCLNVDCGVLPS